MAHLDRPPRTGVGGRKVATYCLDLPGIEPADLERLFAMYRRNLLAASTFTPNAHRVRSVVFEATRRPPQESEMRLATWRELVGDLTVEPLPGDHYTLLRDPLATVLAERLSRLLS